MAKTTAATKALVTNATKPTKATCTTCWEKVARTTMRECGVCTADLCSGCQWSHDKKTCDRLELLLGSRGTSLAMQVYG